MDMSMIAAHIIMTLIASPWIIVTAISATECVYLQNLVVQIIIRFLS